MKIRSMRLRNFLGYGDPGLVFDPIGEREVIVGANGSGKSNFLRAVEFAGKALRYEIPDGRAYVHRGDWERSLFVEIGVEFESVDNQAFATSLAYGVTSEMSQTNPEWSVPQSTLNRLVRSALTVKPRFFDRFLATHRTYIVIASLAGLGQQLLPRVEFRSEQGSLYLGRQGILTTASQELSGWGGFDLQREILVQVAERDPEALKSRPLDLTRVAGVITDVAREWTPEELVSRLHRGEVLPLALRLEPTPMSVDRPDMDGGDPALIQLRTQAADRGHEGQNLGLYDLINLTYNGSFISLSDSRSRPEAIPLEDIGVPAGYDPTVTGNSLPLLLFFLKNGFDPRWRAKYGALQRAFKELTGLGFDVALHSVPESPPAPESLVGRTSVNTVQGIDSDYVPQNVRRYPHIVFEEEGYSFLIDFAASGYFEVLLVLATSMGPSESVVLLDEPVLNLHPSKQRELYAFLTKQADALRNQLLIVTHSGSLVSPDDLARAVRMEREGGVSRMRRLESHDTWQTAQTVKELDRSPRLLESLFSRGVVLVEGGAEAAALPIWFEKCPGGNMVPASGILFLDAGGDTHFGALTRILKAWGIPYRIIADDSARDRVKELGDFAKTYPFADFSDLLRTYFRDQLPHVVTEVGSSGGDKDPAVARVLASSSDPPTSIVDLWDWVKPFLKSS